MCIYVCRDVFVNSPCGSGKMNIFFAGVLLLRKVKNMPKGLGIILEPLVAISEEKRKNNPPLPVMFLDRKGNGKISKNCNASEDFEKEVENGKVDNCDEHSEVESGDLLCRLVDGYINCMFLVH